jgi:putative nucleotidyltransferase with HDIG domain
MPYITIKNGPDKGRSFEINDQPVTVGRDKTQTIQVLDQGVSRAHAEVFKLGELYIIRDLNSTNGTFVNRERIKEEVIKSSDEITVGNTQLVLTEKPGLPDEPPAPALSDEEPDDMGISTVEFAVEDAVNAARSGGSKIPSAAGGQVLESRNLAVMFDIGRLLKPEVELEAGIGDGLDALVKAIEANQGYLLAVDLEKGKITAKTESTREASEGGTRKISRAIVKHVAKTGRPTLISDAMIDDRFHFSESIVFRKIRSVICVPLLSFQGTDQVVYLHRSDGPGFTVADLELAAQVALQFSLASANRRYEVALRGSMDSAVAALVQAIEAYDVERRGHSTRVADYSQAVGMQLGLPKEEVQKVRLAALLHDVGKLVVHITESGQVDLSKRSDGLSRSDEKHVREGEKIVGSIRGGEELLPGVKYHHERADGSGFPYKLKNAETPLMARIVIVANAFDNACEYKQGNPTAPIRDVLKDFATRGGKDFDDDVLKALLICHRNDTLHKPPDLFGRE